VWFVSQLTPGEADHGVAGGGEGGVVGAVVFAGSVVFGVWVTVSK
jgi:hypothetical protein